MRVHHAQTDHPDPYSLPPGYGEACEVSTRRLFPWSFASMSKGPIRRCVRVATSRTSKTVIGLVWVAQMASPTEGLTLTTTVWVRILRTQRGTFQNPKSVVKINRWICIQIILTHYHSYSSLSLAQMIHHLWYRPIAKGQEEALMNVAAWKK